MKHNEVAKLRKWDFYEKFRKIVAIICMIVGCIWFRVAVFKNWHLIDGFNNCENIGDVFVGIFEIIFMEILPLAVAFIPGGLGGGTLGYLGSSIISFVVIVVSAIYIGIYDVYKWGKNKNQAWRIKRIKKLIRKKCNHVEGFVERVQDTIGDVRTQNNYENLTKLFIELGSNEIYEAYLSERNSIDGEVINKLRYMFIIWKVNYNFDKWSINNVFLWCENEKKVIENCRRVLSGNNLIELKSAYERVR